MRVVKVQRPLATNDSNQPWLVYDEDKSRVESIPAYKVPEHVKEQMLSLPKAYFEAHFADGHWRIGDRVKDRNW
jgi:hypothetical protein